MYVDYKYVNICPQLYGHKAALDAYAQNIYSFIHFGLNCILMSNLTEEQRKENREETKTQKQKTTINVSEKQDDQLLHL